MYSILFWENGTLRKSDGQEKKIQGILKRKSGISHSDDLNSTWYVHGLLRVLHTGVRKYGVEYLLFIDTPSIYFWVPVRELVHTAMYL